MQQSNLKSLTIERLQQVIDRVDVEGFQRELIIGGDENDYRHWFALDGFQHAEAVQFRHLNIEKDEVG